MRPLPVMAAFFLTARFLFGASAPRFDYQAKAERMGAFTVRKNLVYGIGAVQSGAAARELLADVFLPKGLDAYRKAAIIFIHGGSFQSGDKNDEYGECRYFARKGFVTVAINYRLRGDKPPCPPGAPVLAVASYVRAALVDAKTAVRWVHSMADSFGIDEERIFLRGTSAGAIASLAAGVTGPGTFATDIPGEPIPPGNSPGASSEVRGIIDFCGGLYGMVDSIDADDPPILIYHGIEDKTVPVAQALAVRDRCLTVGLQYEFYPIEGGRHCPSQPAENGKTLRQVTHEFILKRMDGRGEPVLRKASFP